MDALGTVHLLAAGLALGSGASVAIARKGTRRHRLSGRFYLVSMLALNLTALMIYDLTGRVNVFHVFAVLSMATLAAGWLPALYKRGHWRPWHARFMMWSYAGLLMAAVSETATRLPIIRSMSGFWIAVAVCSFSLMFVAAFVIERSARPFGKKTVEGVNP